MVINRRVNIQSGWYRPIKVGAVAANRFPGPEGISPPVYNGRYGQYSNGAMNAWNRSIE